jgi:hypothetical protein
MRSELGDPLVHSAAFSLALLRKRRISEKNQAEHEEENDQQEAHRRYGSTSPKSAPRPQAGFQFAFGVTQSQFRSPILPDAALQHAAVG